MEKGITPTLGKQSVTLENVLCNSFGFGGNDSSLLFSTHPTTTDEPVETRKEVKVLSRVELTSEDQLADIRKYVKPLEARRMGKIIKSSLLSSMEALAVAGIESLMQSSQERCMAAWNTVSYY